jgi:hypothetical protein
MLHAHELAPQNDKSTLAEPWSMAMVFMMDLGEIEPVFGEIHVEST